VPDVEHTPHENTFLYYLRKGNHKWVKLKSYKGLQSARLHKVTFTLDDYLALKALTFTTYKDKVRNIFNFYIMINRIFIF